MPQIIIARPKTPPGGRVAEQGTVITLNGEAIRIKDGSSPVVIETGAGDVTIYTGQDAADRIGEK